MTSVKLVGSKILLPNNKIDWIWSSFGFGLYYEPTMGMGIYSGGCKTKEPPNLHNFIEWKQIFKLNEFK